MLHELRITGLGVIDDLDLELHPGLNVLTGETGAGKTMVTVGLMLALGGRGAASLVRSGARAARIQARFDAPGELADGWSEDGEVILARSVGADGKSSARIGGQLATASALARIGSELVEVHGQHQAQRLLSSGTQTAFLDRFAGASHIVALAAYRETFEECEATRSELDQLRVASREREREADLLAYQVNEIQAVDPQPGESGRLLAEESRLGHVERLVEESAAAESVLAGDEGLADALGGVAARMGAAAELDPSAGELAARSRGLAAELGELARDVRAYRETLLVDPVHLQDVRERLASLRGLQRKYGETDEEVVRFCRQAEERLGVLTGSDERLAQLEAREADLAEQAHARAEVVSLGRAAAAPKLAGALGRELEALGMAEARVEVGLDALPGLGATGAERVELRFSGGPAQPLQPLARAASGGELSRTMLACRSVLADLDDIPTLVFDEVDAGIGGQAGLAVGKRLARLARDRQIVVVTHLPQIACFADRHVQVRKDAGDATVEVVDEAARVAELSRMLAGLADSESAVSHAEELLGEAAKVRSGA